MKIFEASFHVFPVDQMDSNFAYVFFRPFPGDNFFVFLNFEKMADLWHFESYLRYENFWSFVSYISSSPNEFKFCIRLLQTIPWGSFFRFFEFRKNDRRCHFESSLSYENFRSFVFYISSSPIEFKFCVRLLQTIPLGNFFFFFWISTKRLTLSILKAP